MSLAENLTIQSIDFRGGQPRRLGNASPGSIDATLSLTGDSTGTFVSVRTPTTFTIEGSNIGTGTGRIGLQISNNGQWSANAGSKLVLKPNVLQAGSGYSFSKVGAGEMNVQGNADVSGTVTVAGGLLHVSGAAGALSSATKVSVAAPGYLWADNGDGAFLADRINNSATIEMTGGTFQVSGNGSVPYTEQVGQLSLAGSKGDYYVVSVNSNADLRVASQQRTAGLMEINVAAGSSVHQSALGGISDWGTGDWAIYNGMNWGKVDNSDGLVSAFTAYQTSPTPGTWTVDDNVSVTSNISVASNTNVQSLKLSGGHLITLTGTNFLSTRGILAAGGGPVGDGITGSGSLTAKTGGDNSIKLFVSDTANNFTISAPIADNSDGAVDFVKAGAGTLLLDATPTHTGTTYVARGMLKLGQFDGEHRTLQRGIDRDRPFSGAWQPNHRGLSGSGAACSATLLPSAP
jgi:autotransporter-associated beta strand protein